jgi:hypothetical protein
VAGTPGGRANTVSATNYVYLPPDKPPDKQFRVKLSLKEWQWKLAGIDMPQELVKRCTDKKRVASPTIRQP